MSTAQTSINSLSNKWTCQLTYIPAAARDHLLHSLQIGTTILFTILRYCPVTWGVGSGHHGTSREEHGGFQVGFLVNGKEELTRGGSSHGSNGEGGGSRAGSAAFSKE